MDALLAYNSDSDNSGGDSSYNRDDSILPTVNDSIVELEGGLRVASSFKKTKIVHGEENASDNFSSALFKRNLESNEKKALVDRIPEKILQNGTSVVFSGANGIRSGDNAGVSRSISRAGGMNAPKASDLLLPDKTGKAKTALPPPSDLDQLFAAAPSRIRSFPHVDGNFAVHVYAPVTFSAAAKHRMAAPLIAAESAFPSLTRVETGGGGSAAISADSHVSLSRSCAIRFQQIESLVALLRHGFRGQHMYQLEFDSWQAFVNEGKTRSFLALEATGSGVAEFTRQVALVDSAYTRHELPPFHKTPRPHISLMWTLGDATRELASFCDSLNETIEPSNANVSLVEDTGRKCTSNKPKHAKAKEKSATWRAHVTQVVCKIGQREHCVWQVH